MTTSVEKSKVEIINQNDRSEKVGPCKRIGAALFYAASSFLIVMFNKSLLTSYSFPSIQVVGIGQMVTTIVILYVGKLLGIISFPDMGKDIPRKIWPLPIIYIFNLIFGLGSTKKISLPMFTVLRRFTVLFTMLGEYFLLGVKPSLKIKLVVCAMLLGAIVAAANDLAFDIIGYAYVLSNDIFTAGYGVFMKKKINAKDLGKFGILFYNSAFMVIPATLLAYSTGEFDRAMNFEAWRDPSFQVLFFLVCIMGFVLMYATLLCTAYNSALTTTITGTLKNLLVTYVGMMFGGDYIFSWANFVGLNISVTGSLFYTYYAFVEKMKPVSTTIEHKSTSFISKS
ncbi:putative UDP-N-acetylglucosamine/UDP-glucose/GDP-mannose transporter-like [Apostichopus japonicus]|uniref:Putative UDP-N-acetylglucosamine/UDP-glucose/GDP-mannose transporter-like n=1 Tax=Stichopus japonicus TaxID=307972 RepID=A0A2G8JR25_STIJA|nr:putative UDP-N-acetylglucosamine/UDP-glucose/GDP-mannose transporter-like [Apostichopus japonicus]